MQVGEELTYDYRFCGAEALPCSCGAAACRGTVNEPPKPHEVDGGALWVPRSAVAPYVPPAAGSSK